MNIKQYFKSGDAWIWINAGAVATCLLMIIGMLLLLAVNGLHHFWPAQILQANYVTPSESTQIIGEMYDKKTTKAERLAEAGEPVPAGMGMVDRYSIKMGNRDVTNQDFKWVVAPFLTEIQYPAELYKIERTEWGNFYGKLVSVSYGGTEITGKSRYSEFAKAVTRAQQLRAQITRVDKSTIGAINHNIEQLRLSEKRLSLNGAVISSQDAADIAKQRAELAVAFTAATDKVAAITEKLDRDTATFVVANGANVSVPLHQIIDATQPNAMGLWAKCGQFLHNIWRFVADDPRESNTEGGVFPAIFGTVTMVLLMTIFVTPLGVIAAIYLREYASQGRITQIVRIAVNNLAGIPSIVYGVFGLGFFIYVLGGSIDSLFYPESAPQPVFGTPGLLWASITLALLTLPVVIVATEEGLTRIPRSLKEGSLALGATKVETLWRVILPMAAPSIMTGVILAIARAAGEVAPLMLVGVVKLAPNLPIDGNFPFIHMDQKFMHLGFHIYDVGFQSPNVEASRPLVYATALLLVLLVGALNLVAIVMRNKMREKFKSLEH